MAGFKTLVAFALVLAIAGNAAAGKKMKKPASVAELVINSPNFSILLEAVQAADPSILALLSRKKAKLTVFAPNNDAFVALLGEIKLTKEELLAEKQLVTEVLLNHVLLGAAVRSRQLKKAQLVQTALRGERGQLGVLKQRSGVRVITSTDQVAKVIATDVMAGRSIVHVVNKVLVPASKAR